MRPRQTFRQLAICFGMLSSIGFGAAASAPVCSQVFTTFVVSEDAKIALVNDLALIRIELDQARSEGKLTMAQRALESEFQKRFDEAYRFYEGILTQTAFKDLIRAQIIYNQKLAQRKVEIKEEQRQSLNELIPIDSFSVERRQPDVVPDELVYVPGIDGLLIRSGTVFYKYDLQAKTTEVVLDKPPLVKQVSGTKIYYVLKGGQFASRDLITGTEQIYFENVFNKNYYLSDKALSKNGGWLAIKNDYATSLTLFNSHSKQVTKYKVFKMPSLLTKINNLSDYEYIAKFQFISANEMLVFSSKGKVMVLNLVTGDRTAVKWPEQFNYDYWMKVTEDGYLVIGKFRTLGIVKINDLANMDKKIKIQNFSGSIGDVVRLNKGTLVAQMFDKQHEVVTIGTETMQASEVPAVETRWQTSRGALMAVDTKGGRVFLGGWHRDGVPQGSLDMFPLLEILTPKKVLGK